MAKSGMICSVRNRWLLCAVVVLAMAVVAPAAVDIDQIYISDTKFFEDGTPEANPWSFFLGVEGSGITTADFEDPNGGSHTLIEESPGHWFFEAEGYATLTLLRAAFPTGTYTVAIDDGLPTDDEVELYHSPGSEPGGVVDFVHPDTSLNEHLAVPLLPTAEWTSASGLGNVNTLSGFLFEYTDYGLGTEDDEQVADEWWPNNTQTTWTLPSPPGPLTPATWYELAIGMWNSTNSAKTMETGGDPFTYFDAIGYDNAVDFLTVPEPATVVLLVAGGVGMVVRRRKRS